jgi:hypothetical protein
MKHFLLSLLLFASALSAQTVRFSNPASVPFDGWKRATIDRLPGALAGGDGDLEYRVGRQIGLETWAVDVKVRLQPGQLRVVDLGALPKHASFEPPAPPAGLAEHFGGVPAINGAPMTLLSLLAAKDDGARDTIAPRFHDGAGWTAHCRGRVPGSRMLWADLWLHWNPGDAHATGEVKITASNPTITDVVETFPPAIDLSFGDGIVAPTGAPFFRLVPASTTFCDGQARVVPIVVFWPRLIEAARKKSVSDAERLAFNTASVQHVTAVGIQKLLPQGNPRLPENFNAVQWVRQSYEESVRRLHTWEPMVVGVPAQSTQTGEQEDQVFKGAEALVHPGCEIINYLNAIQWSKRPCHHLEADGSSLNPALHPNLRIWNGRAHWHHGVSPDRLGKTGQGLLPEPNSMQPDAALTPFKWWGPDNEHRLMNRLAAACRLRDTPACQELLRAQVALYQLELTTGAGLSTSAAFASRSIGYESWFAVLAWHCLEDRAAAQRAKDHWLARWGIVLRKHFHRRDGQDRLVLPLTPISWAPDGFADQLKNSPWQGAVCAYFLDVAGEQFGVSEARATALHLAKMIVDRAFYIGQDGKWHTHSTIIMDAAGEMVTHDPAGSTIFDAFGMPLAPAAVLRHEPQHERAMRIWTEHCRSFSLSKQLSWLAPEIQ